MKSKFILFTIFLVVSQVSVGQDFKFGKVSKEELMEKSHPTEPDADAAILYREYKTNFMYSQSDGFYAVTDIVERIKIYTKEGFEWGTKGESLYQSGSGGKEEMSGLKAYTYSLSAEGKIESEKLRNDGIFDEKASKYRRLKKFTMPNLSEGCVIEYRYSIKSPFIQSINPYRFQENIPVEKVYLRFAAPEYINYKSHQKGWLPFKINKDSRERTMKYRYQVDAITSGDVIDRTETGETKFKEFIYTVNMTKVSSVKEEKYTGNIDNYLASLKFELAFTKFPNASYNSYSQSWEDVSESIYESDSFGGELEKSNHFKDEIDQLIDGVSGQKEKMMRIFEFVKSKITWNSGYGIFTDEGAKEAYKEGSGNVAEINLSLTAMLRYAGLNANPVLVSTKKNGIPIFPTQKGFNYVISGVIIDGAVYLFDATNKLGEVNILEERLLNWQGRMILDEKTSAWVPLVPTKHAIQNTMLNVEITEDLAVQGISKNRRTGHYAMEMRNSYQGLNVDAKRKTLEKDMVETEVDNIVFENLKTLHKPVSYSYSFDASNALESVGGKLYFSPLWYLTAIENPFKLDERKYPVDYGFIRKDRYLISINIPDGYAVESMPENTNFAMEQGIGNFKYVISNSGNKIQLSVEVAINEAVIPAENYGSLKKFYELLIDKENEKVVLSKI
jgi:transglutaminase-like putative cysteine protease